MKNYRLKITDEAADQLFAIAKWYSDSSQSLDVAVKWYDGFLDALEELQHDPSRFALARENEKFDFELRELRYGSGKRVTHRALFRVVADTVEVLSIRHHAQDELRSDDLPST